MENIAAVLEGGAVVDKELKKYTLQEIMLFKFVSLTSSDVERSFSQYKTVLRDNRRLENLRNHLIVKCNSFD